MRLIAIAFIFLLSVSCACTKKKNEEKVAHILNGFMSNATMPMVIYKTRSDYSQWLPVQLDASRTKIIQYPSPNDIYYRDTLAVPTTLHDGYLLDNMGLNANSAYTDIALTEYDKVISLDSLMSRVLDRYPFLEMYICGNRSIESEPIEKVNFIIDQNALNKCTVVISAE